MSIVIKVEGLGKKYIIGHEERERYTALRDVIVRKAKKIFSFSKNKTANYRREEFWALKDISFEVKQGDRLGIIGRNGAGKSTLLKILSRITEPTTGSVKIKGRVASLLEVGTGFHPELTGRENIFLNGAILGMSRAEVKKKFDEIVDFSEVEKFLDTPVKRFSSGMYVRLAFAVAAHLEPEILLVDEVLAIGDAEFQKKCLGKMEDVSKNEGRTVLFVSHNMSAVQNLCNTGILLKNGIIDNNGDISKIIVKYREELDHKEFKVLTDVSQIPRSKGNKNLIKNIWMEMDNNKTHSFPFSMNFDIFFEFSHSELIKNPNFYFQIENFEGIKIFSICNEYLKKTFSPTKHGVAKCTIINNNLKPGTYFISVGISYGLSEWIELIERCHMFNIDEYDFFNSGVTLTKNEAVILLESRIEIYNYKK